MKRPRSVLNPSGTRYLRLFRHKDMESVLEGEVTVTGLSFVMKHKVSSLRELFNWLKKSPKPQENLNQVDDNVENVGQETTEDASLSNQNQP